MSKRNNEYPSCVEFQVFSKVLCLQETPLSCKFCPQGGRRAISERVHKINNIGHVTGTCPDGAHDVSLLSLKVAANPHYLRR